MNSTIWETLTEFVNWLGQNNICKIDHTEKGWFVTYIDKNPWQIGKVHTDQTIPLMFCFSFTLLHQPSPHHISTVCSAVRYRLCYSVVGLAVGG